MSAIRHDIIRTPWRKRRVVWPGMWFRTLPFPYLLHRWDVIGYYADDPNPGAYSTFAGFFRRSSAEEYEGTMRVIGELVDELDTANTRIRQLEGLLLRAIGGRVRSVDDLDWVPGWVAEARALGVTPEAIAEKDLAALTGEAEED